jgi:hypothetical protein
MACGPWLGPGAYALLEFGFRADLGPDAPLRLTLDTRTGLLGRSEAHLRVRRVGVSDAEAPEPALQAGAPGAAAAGGVRR